VNSLPAGEISVAVTLTLVLLAVLAAGLLVLRSHRRR
jgi:hypothetical protein